MKIIAEQKGKVYKVSLLDGGTTISEENASSVQERDDIIWRMSSTYDVIDISIKNQKKLKLTNVPSIPVISEDDAADFFNEEEEFTHTRIFKAIEEGVKYDLETINLFELNGTGVMITSDRPNWLSGLQEALHYFESTEKYEHCTKIQKLMNLV
jgi:hypothetical protein